MKRTSRPDRQQVQVGGRVLTVSSLDKVVYPDTGTTKADVLRYYLDVGEVLLPHLSGRPVTLRRWPDGVLGEAFFQKRCPDHRPEWMTTHPVPRSDRDALDERIEHCGFDELAALAWAANLGALELHVPMGRVPDVLRPTAVVFDLDPGAPADVLDCAWLALRLLEALEHLGLEGVPKTSGGKGLQVYVPVDQGATSADDARAFAHAIAETLERVHPDRIVTTQAKTQRPGKVLIDWTQNHPIKTTVCAYSLRGREQPTVSTPLTWDEVADAASAGDATRLRFTYDEVLARVGARGDLFARVLGGGQRLPSLRN